MYHKSQMRLALRTRSNSGTAFVLLLILCVFVFAIYLKVWPPISAPPDGHSGTQVRFWMKTSSVQNTRIKLATVSGFVFMLLCMLRFRERKNSSERPKPASTLSLQNVFAESAYWFRPPPPFSSF